LGAYAEQCVVSEHFLVHLPAAIDFETAAASMQKRGLTAQFLLRRIFRVGPGHTVLIHAAAGGNTTFPTSLNFLKPMGCFASFGVSSGAIESFNIMMLAENGSWAFLRKVGADNRHSKN
jgi:NADPH:quinone reductase-like Zn-dependent oxidoreductase